MGIGLVVDVWEIRARWDGRWTRLCERRKRVLLGLREGVIQPS